MNQILELEQQVVELFQAASLAEFKLKNDANYQALLSQYKALGERIAEIEYETYGRLYEAQNTAKEQLKQLCLVEAWNGEKQWGHASVTWRETKKVVDDVKAVRYLQEKGMFQYLRQEVNKRELYKAAEKFIKENPEQEFLAITKEPIFQMRGLGDEGDA